APRILASGLGMGGVLYLLGPVLASWLGGGAVVKVAALALLCGGGAAVYFALCHLSGAARLDDVRQIVKPPADSAA
ncbi:MAG TPA: hypothetical protein VEB64_00955, partial [Azospirillaceae bacterium]|nr:hypothetical protein [Azospirillaceae bacterium]